MPCMWLSAYGGDEHPLGLPPPRHRSRPQDELYADECAEGDETSDESMDNGVPHGAPRS